MFRVEFIFLGIECISFKFRLAAIPRSFKSFQYNCMRAYGVEQFSVVKNNVQRHKRTKYSKRETTAATTNTCI